MNKQKQLKKLINKLDKQWAMPNQNAFQFKSRVKKELSKAMDNLTILELEHLLVELICEVNFWPTP
jgi:hypothetical protein